MTDITVIKNGPSSSSFFDYFCLLKQTLQFLQQKYVKNVMTIQYTALGFKPATFGYESPQ